MSNDLLVRDGKSCCLPSREQWTDCRVASCQAAFVNVCSLPVQLQWRRSGPPILQSSTPPVAYCGCVIRLNQHTLTTRCIVCLHVTRLLFSVSIFPSPSLIQKYTLTPLRKSFNMMFTSDQWSFCLLFNPFYLLTALLQMLAVAYEWLWSCLCSPSVCYCCLRLAQTISTKV